MFGGLEEKTRQMHAALGNIVENDLSKIIVHKEISDSSRNTWVRFSEGTTEAELQNTITLIVSNIASLKDHLKKWCQTNNVSFQGESLIRSNRDVALVHDLWNSDKHGGLDRQPRSGIYPKIANLNKVLSMNSGTIPGSVTYFTMDPKTGEIVTGSSGSGKIEHKIIADVVDEQGTRVGDFEEICFNAASAWEALMIGSGVTF